MANCLLSIVAIICSNMALSMGGYLLNNSKIWWKFVAFHSGGKFQKFRGARTKFFFFTTLTKKTTLHFFSLIITGGEKILFAFQFACHLNLDPMVHCWYIELGTQSLNLGEFGLFFWVVKHLLVFICRMVLSSSLYTQAWLPPMPWHRTNLTGPSGLAASKQLSSDMTCCLFV